MNAEAVLLVNDSKPQTVKGNGLLKQCMGANGELD